MLKIGNVEYNTDLETVLSDLQFDLAKENIKLLQRIKPSGTHIMVQCPFHKDGQERKPSASIRKTDGVTHCFTCNKTWDLATVIGHCFGSNKKFGESWLNDHYTSDEYEDARKIELNLERNLKQPSPVKKYLDPSILDQFRYIHPYMYERKLTKDIIRKFDLGYDATRNCIVFPNRDPQGNLLFLATRNVASKYFYYPPRVEKPVYGLYEINRERAHGVKINEIIICESMIDALTCWVYGKYAVALNGVGSENQIKMLNQYDCRSYILATDNDEAGKKAREKLKKQLSGKIVKEFDYKTYPEGCKDINDMTKEQFDNLSVVIEGLAGR